MQKKEQKFNTEFNVFLRKTFKKTCACELKHTRGKNCLPFSEVQEHQINALLASKHSTFVYKISDAGLSFKPYDCFSLSGVLAFVVIKYASGVVYMIDVDDFVNERDRSTRKSLTEQRAKEIATKVINK